MKNLPGCLDLICQIRRRREIWTMLSAQFFGLPIPLLPIQIRWINLVTDGLPGLALARERTEKDIMRRAPRKGYEIIHNAKINAMEKVLVKTKWAIDRKHSEIGFKLKHLVVAGVRGTFAEFGAYIAIAEEDVTTAEIDLWIDPTSINTANERRDTHLRSADFFYVQKFKQINFTNARIVKTDEEGKYDMYGELTMRGIKKEIQLDVEFDGVLKDPQGDQKAICNICGKINRKDWGLNWNKVLETGGVLVSDDVWIVCEIQLVKQQ